MTKWFDTNYHYLVPEFTDATEFTVASERLFDEVAEAQALGHAVKVALIGPVTFLWLGKGTDDKLALLEREELTVAELSAVTRLVPPAFTAMAMSLPTSISMASHGAASSVTPASRTRAPVTRSIR